MGDALRAFTGARSPSAPAAQPPALQRSAPVAALAQASAAPSQRNTGFERYLERGLNTSRRGSLGGRRAGRGAPRHTSGPMAGGTTSEGVEKMRDQYAGMGDSERAAWEAGANMEDVRSAREREASGTPASSPTGNLSGGMPAAPTVSGTMAAGSQSKGTGTNDAFNYFKAKTAERQDAANKAAWGDLATGARAQNERSGVSAAAGMEDNARVTAARRQARTGDTNGLASREQRASEALQRANPALDTSTNRNLVRGGYSR